jgi:hypothetical protein
MTNGENHKTQQVIYTTAISKGAAMLEETRRLLECWDPEESLDDFAMRVHKEGLLGNATAYRTKDIVKRVFALRYLKPNNKAAVLLKKILESDLPLRTFNELVFLYSARQDPLIYDFTTDAYWQAVRRGRAAIDTEMVINFLSEASMDGRLENVWSESVSIRIARCIIGILRDIGFVRERVRGRREIVEYRISDEGIAIIARELHEQGVNDSFLGEHPDWGLFGFKPNEILSRLDSLGERRGLIVQHAGSVVRITWSVNSMEGLIDVLTGKTV